MVLKLRGAECPQRMCVYCLCCGSAACVVCGGGAACKVDCADLIYFLRNIEFFELVFWANHFRDNHILHQLTNF